MPGISRQWIAVAGVGVSTLILLPNSLTQQLGPVGRTRGGQVQQPAVAAQPAPTAPAAPTTANLLQQPAHDALVTFAGGHLLIHAENASLAAILQQVGAQSGMKVSGLGSDERVFGTFGPGTPPDVLADLLNGTAYDLVLIGSTSYGAPRELILTPSRGGAAAPPPALAAAPQNRPEEAASEPESPDGPPPQPDVPPPASAVPPGIRTPQQLFQQLQQMRQAQQQQIPQQEQQQTTTPPQ